VEPIIRVEEVLIIASTSLTRGTPRQGIGRRPKSAEKLLGEQRRNRFGFPAGMGGQIANIRAGAARP